MVLSGVADPEYWLYEQPYERPSDFVDDLRNYVNGSHRRLNVLIVTTTAADLKSELESYVPVNFEQRILHSDPLFSIEITRKLRKNKKLAVKARIMRHPEFPSAYLIFSECKVADFKNVITKLVTRHYPLVSLVFLTNTEMRIILQELESSQSVKIRTKVTVGKRRLKEIARSGEERPAEEDVDEDDREELSQLTYGSRPYASAFDEIESNDQWIQGVRYVAIKKALGQNIREQAFSGYIGRSSFFSIRSRLEPLISTIIPRAISLASVRNDLLKASSASAAELNPEPVVIKFGKKLFSDISKNKSYIEAIGSMKNSSISLYHGNPYIHLSLLDYLDGSSYDLWVLSEDGLILIPQLSASVASMARLVNHVFEVVGEGVVEKYGT